MTKRLYVGVDLGITTPSQAAVFDPEKNEYIGKSFKFKHTIEGFQNVLNRIVRGEYTDAELVFCMEPTSMAWLPLSVYLMANGHTVCRVTPQKASALRKYFKKHTKSNHIDARTLAKQPFVDPDGVYPLCLPTKSLFTLQRYCRQRDKIMGHISSLKNRVESPFTFVNPTLLRCFNDNKFTKVSRAVMRKYSNPFAIRKLGVKRLLSFLNNHAHGTVEPELAQTIYDASVSITEIYGEAVDKGMMVVDFEEVEYEINLTLDTIEYEEKQVKELEKRIAKLYEKEDPYGILKSQPGFGDVIAAVILSASGDPDRFQTTREYKAFCGGVPRKRATGDTDRKGLPITGAGSYLLKKYYHMAAETARKRDVEYAEFYHRLKKRGLHHNQAVTAGANKMAGRTIALLRRIKEVREGMDPEDARYRFRDLSGRTISKKKARDLVLSHYPSKKRAANSKLVRGSLSRHNRDNSSNKENGYPLVGEYAEIGNSSREKLDRRDTFPIYDQNGKLIGYAIEPSYVGAITKQVMDRRAKRKRARERLSVGE